VSRFTTYNLRANFWLNRATEESRNCKPDLAVVFRHSASIAGLTNANHSRLTFLCARSVCYHQPNYCSSRFAPAGEMFTGPTSC